MKIARPVHRLMALAASIVMAWSLAPSVVHASGPEEVLPVRPSEGAQLLHGSWKFKYVAAVEAGADEAFFQPKFEIGAWKEISVPSHWELQGFAEPQYGSEVRPGTGLYRRTFTVPENWSDQRVFLRFDGVLYGFTAWVNGRQVGEWASGFNPVTFDITEALLPGGAPNVLAVRVTTRSKGWDFDTMDCWGLSGIYRDVTVFSLPSAHFRDYTARTTLQPDGSAQLQLDLMASEAGAVNVRIFDPSGTQVQQATVSLATDGTGAVRLPISGPKLWTAETPWLYRLELDLAVANKVVQRFNDRIGLRQVTTDDGVLKFNGVPVKLRGIDHHDMWPEGRVATEEGMRRDLELIRDANINFIRTSHYPPHPRLLELCDEMGIYVDCEVPFIHGREHHNDPSYQEVLLSRARATVQRDKNRPCIILWSIGNENHITELGLNTGRLVKQLDPTRPITYPTMGSYFRTSYQDFPAFVDLYSPHYPGADTIRNYAEKLTRPIVVTEYAHQRGLARGGEGVQGIWEAMYRAPRVAGGAVWMFQDQGILRSVADRKMVKDGDLMVWLDEHRYYDTHGYFGVDGIVYSDRTPQTDYWQVRKVYSPVQISERSLSVQPGAQTLVVHAENRFDFRSLAGTRLEWSVYSNGHAIAEGVLSPHAKPHEVEALAIPVTLPSEKQGDVLTLNLRLLNESGRSFHERALALEYPSARSRWSLLKSKLQESDPTLEKSDALIAVSHRDYALRLDRTTGQVSILDGAGNVLVAGMGPHTGRKLTINDLGKTRDGEATHWSGELLREVTRLTTDAKKTAEGVAVSVAGRYPRPGVPNEAVEGEYRLLLKRDGTIEVSYDYVPLAATGVIVEAGLALAVAPVESEFRWIGQGPYAGYPGRDRLNEFGVFHLHRDDLYFPGNRRDVDLAGLADAKGTGVFMAGEKLTVSVEKREGETVFSHVALIPGQRLDRKETGENVENKAEIKTSSIKSISGKFVLLPVGRRWPEPMVQWFGAAETLAVPFKPFLRAYDQ